MGFHLVHLPHRRSNEMKRWFCCAVASCCAGILPAEEYRWVNDSVGNDVTGCYLWGDKANWQDERPPTGSPTDTVSFTNCVGGERYISMPAEVETGKIYFSDDSRTVLIGGSLLSGGIRAKSTTANVASRVYADILVSEEGTTLGTVEICGDMRLSAGNRLIYSSVGQNYFRYDLYANKGGEVRDDPGTQYAYSSSWGAFHFIAPQGSDEAVTAKWTLAKGSPYAKIANGESLHTLCAGTFVSASGALPEGTFLRRIFDGGVVELSQAALTDGEAELTFAAFSPKLEQTVYSLMSGGEAAHPIDLSKYREKDEFKFTARNFKYNTGKLELVSSTGIPGTLVVRNASGFTVELIFSNGHIEIQRPEDSTVTAGFYAASTVRMNGASSKARVTVPFGIDGVLNGVTKLDGAFLKDGEGTLILNMKDVYSTSTPNTGTVTVEEGTVRVVGADGGTAAVANLVLKAGANVEIEGELAVTGTVAAEAGAKLSGGRLLLPRGQGLVPNLEVKAGASVVSVADTAVGRPVYDYPAANVPGDPAFWFDCESGLVLAEGDATTAGSKISRWNDKRGTDAKYMFATNVAGVYPTVQVNAYGKRYVNIEKMEAGKTEIEKTAALVWNKPLSNIRHLFLVHDVSSGGGSILGSSPRIASSDFNRRVSDGDKWARILSNNAAESVRTAKAWFDGIPFASQNHETAAPYVASAKEALPLLVEFRMNGVAEADCFGFLNSEDGNNGNKKLYECIVYTNDLSEIERLQVVEYLMSRHQRAHANYSRLGGVSGRIAEVDVAECLGFSVPEGEISAVDVFSGSGTFEKAGGGELYIDDMVAPDAAVKVTGGILSIRSVAVDAESLPVEPVIHIDASDALTTDAAENGGSAITCISDRRGAGYPQAVCRNAGTLPLTAVQAVGGKTVIDFGEYKYDSNNPGQALQFKADGANARYLDMRSTVAVIGTSKGGGFLAGELDRRLSYNDYGGLWRDATSYANGMISANISTPASVKSNKKPAVRWRLNGEDVENPTTTGFSGGYDLVSMATIANFGMNGLNACHYGTRTGGQELGEQLFFNETLSQEQVLAVEAYLREKWFGVETAGYRGSRIKSLEMTAGAKVVVYGNSPLIVNGLSGEGTVEGPVAIASGGSIKVALRPEGEEGGLSVGEIALDNKISIEFADDASSLDVGTYVIVSSHKIKEGDSCAWVAPKAGKRSTRVRTIDGAVVLDVFAKGSVMLLR